MLSGDLLSGLSSARTGSAASLLVRFGARASGSATRAALAAVGGRVVERFPDGPSVVEVRPGVDASAALRRLRANPMVVYAEPDAPVRARGFPDDAYFASQWGLNNDSGNDVDIDAPEAWSITTGNPGIIVAVLDTGIDLRNADLTSRLWTNPAPGRDGVSGGLHGWNFVNKTANVQDNNGHGSHVTGVLAAAGNNRTGIAGVDWNARIMPLKILGSDGGGSTQDAIAGIYFAANHGARVINASWGGNAYSQAMSDAIKYANNKGAVFVTAAGNDDSNSDVDPANYPANYRLPNELVVAAVDSGGNLAGFSNYGVRTVDLAAPGVGIWSTIPGSYASYSGTSMAVPHVSGVVALLAGRYLEFSAAQLVSRVRDTVKGLDSLSGLTISGGIVDADNALTGRSTPRRQAIGANGFTGSGRATLIDVENAILSTDDVYRSRGGTTTAYVTGLYRSIFGRAPDPTGLAYYADQINSGTPRQDIIREFQSFDEAKRTRVARWYIRDLGWDLPLDLMKLDPGVVAWAAMIDDGRDDEAVRALILSYGIAPRGTSAEYVSGLSHAILGHALNAEGLAYYSGQIDEGVGRFAIAEQLITSFESRRTQVAHFYRSELGRPGSLDSLKVDEGVIHWASLVGGW